MKFCLLIIIPFFLISCQCDCEREFNPPRWKRNYEFRYLTVNDLIKSGRLDTLHKDNIESVLGVYDKNNGTYYFYGIGIPKNKITPEPSCLIVSFDMNGKVKDFNISNSCEINH